MIEVGSLVRPADAERPLGVVLENEVRISYPKGVKKVTDCARVIWHRVGVSEQEWCDEAGLVVVEPAEPADTALLKIADASRIDSESIPGVEQLREYLNRIILSARSLGRIEGSGEKPPIHQYAVLIRSKALVYSWVKNHTASAKSGPGNARPRMFGGQMCSGQCGRRSLPGQQFCRECFDSARAWLIDMTEAKSEE
jgi:hypothetical protein